MNQHHSPEDLELEPKAAPSVRKPSFSSFAYMLGWTAGLCSFLVGGILLGQTRTGNDEYVRFSAPKLLTFDELVRLEKIDDPSPQLATRLDELLHTPFLSNEAFYSGAKPNRPSSETLGPFLRATMWNIEEFSLTGFVSVAGGGGRWIQGFHAPRRRPHKLSRIECVVSTIDTAMPKILDCLD